MGKLPAQGAQMRKIISALIFPVPVFLISLVITGLTTSIPGLDYSGAEPPIPLVVGKTLLVLSAALLLHRLLDLFVWSRLRINGQDLPRLVRDLAVGLMWYAAACAVAAYAFNQSLTHLLAASTVALGFISVALQKPILDAFSGVVLALQRPFGMGDWIGVSNDPAPFGRVVEMNWRAVHLMTPNEVIHVIPNSQFTNTQTRLYSKPEPFFRDEISVTLPFHVTTDQGSRILLGAANQLEEVGNLPRKAIVTIHEYSERGVVWKLLYWCPSPSRLLPVRFLIHQNIQRNLKFAGIDIPTPIMNVRRAVASGEGFDQIDGVEPLIQRLSLFSAFTAEDLRYLSGQAISRVVSAGQRLLAEGEAGDSLFILCEGLLEVTKSSGTAVAIVVGQIHPGQFFGERTFLLGEPRSATVVPVVDSLVLEIPKTAMNALIQARPELVIHLAMVLEERNTQTDAKLNTVSDPGTGSVGLVDKMVNRIAEFFEIKNQKLQANVPASNPKTAKSTRLRLVDIGGSANGKSYEVPPAGWTIGRAETANLVLSDDQVSKEHLWIGQVEGRWILKDQNSSNGTYYGTNLENQINQIELKSGMVVSLGTHGASQFKVELS